MQLAPRTAGSTGLTYLTALMLQRDVGGQCQTRVMENENAPTGAQAMAEFETFLAERADAGVLLAVGAEVAYEAGKITVTFHPQAAVPDAAALISVSPYDNHAEFAGTPIAFANEQGEWLRRTVSEVHTRLPDGTPLGSLTSAQLYQLGAGKPLPAAG